MALDEAVEAVDSDERSSLQLLWAISGRHAIENPTDQIIGEATAEIVVVNDDDTLLPPDLIERLNEVGDGVDLGIGVLVEPLEEHVHSHLVFHRS